MCGRRCFENIKRGGGVQVGGLAVGPLFFFFFFLVWDQKPKWSGSGTKGTRDDRGVTTCTR